ncbi:short-chain dehydrogenase [Prochlorococcus sp. HOT_208_60]|nr:short-chain dehydrogenase [Prochlorococcus sp. HOT_208_60]
MTCTNKWSPQEANKIVKEYKSLGINEDIALRTYSARLLGSDPELVLHGGGNTSVKTFSENLFGKKLSVLCVKGSGWDLGTIEPEGHPAVKLDPLIKLKELDSLSDEDMVSIQRQNLINPKSPNPSVETLLHAFLPYKFIDHTHSISILCLADQPNSKEICEEIYGDEIVIVPYIMPGFDLAKLASKLHDEKSKQLSSKNIKLKGMILLKHGVFSFGDSAEESYKNMIEIVKKAEKAIPRSIDLDLVANDQFRNFNLDNIEIIPFLRGLFSKKMSKYNSTHRFIFEIVQNKKILEFSSLKNLKELSIKGVATPDHVIRTKYRPLILDKIPENIFSQKNKDELLHDWLANTNQSLEKYIEDYEQYFHKNNNRVGNTKHMLDPLPRIILIPYFGMISLGESKKAAKVVSDIGQSWIETILSAEKLGEFKPVSEQDIFDLEYWSLEQAKIGNKKIPSHAGFVTLVTGAGGTIGSEISKVFSKNGSEVICLDKNLELATKTAKLCGNNALAIQCDVTNKKDVEETFKKIMANFGGLDILISNAGLAIPGDMFNLDDEKLERSLKINLLSHHHFCQKSLQIFKSQDYFLKNEQNLLGGQLLFNVSKQALNPGKGFGAYGISKSALLALMKQYAIEEGSNNVRSNCINADRIRSGLLNNEMIKSRSKSRGVTEKEYMSGNLLHTEVRAIDVAEAFLSLSKMERTTGTILTVDGGNVAAMPR